MTQSIFPCIWFNEYGEKAAQFYTDTFDGKVVEKSQMIYNLEILGQKFMILNVSSPFETNASISFMVFCEAREEVDKYWKKLCEDGIILMDLAEYPWSKKYGWVRDKFGVTWQLFFGESHGEQRIFPTLMFIKENNGKAFEAIEFYTNIFPDSKIGNVLKYKEGFGGKNHEIPENIQMANFSLDGFYLQCMDNSYEHPFSFNEAMSFVVLTENQEETDHYWNSLIADGGKEAQCGWLKDKFGVSWQITPKRLIELTTNSDSEKTKKAFAAMMKMKKIIIADLESASNP